MTSAPPPAARRHLVWVEYNDVGIPLHVAARLAVTRELRKLGWCVTLVLIGPAGSQAIDGVEVYCFSRPTVYLFGPALFHLKFLAFVARRWSDIDILLFHPLSAPWVLPLRLLRALRGQARPLLLMDTRDLDPPGRHLKSRFRGLYGRLASGLASLWADGQTAITDRMARLVRIPSRQLLGTWPSGVNLEEFAPAQGLRRWPRDTEPVHLVYIGALLHERNLLPLCQAVEIANAAGMQFKLWLYGEGSACDDLQAFSLNTSGRISVCSAVPHARVPEILAQAHVGITSLFFRDAELFQASSPIKLFEYMAAGLPILATRMACHSDFVGSDPYAFWVDQVDASGLAAVLRQVWDARAQLPEMGSLAASAANRWTWHAAAAQLGAAMERALAIQP